jgi:hypothetical protein
MTHIEANAAAHERHEDDAAEFDIWLQENASKVWREVFSEGAYCALCAEMGFDFDVLIFAHAATGEFVQVLQIARKFMTASKNNANAKDSFDKVAADMWRKFKDGGADD